jgi:hypothetical protein
MYSIFLRFYVEYGTTYFVNFMNISNFIPCFRLFFNPLWFIYIFFLFLDYIFQFQTRLFFLFFLLRFTIDSDF